MFSKIKLFHGSLDRRLWLRILRWRFDHSPSCRRVRLELNTDGRQLPFLLSAIHGAGYAIQLAKGDMLFRELLALRHHVPIAARVDTSDVDCALTLIDHPKPGNDQIYVDYDVFSPYQEGHRMPYVMHPSIYYSGNHCNPWTVDVQAESPRLIRVGFFGTHDPLFYSKNYAFDGLNRTQLLDGFLSRYGDQLVSAPVQKPAQFAVSIDHRGGELHPKSFLSQQDYLAALRNSSFSLCLPGWCMPLSHSLIEAMYSGAIPITNAHDFMHPPLRHGVDALIFSTLSEFYDVIEEAQSMPESRIISMRQNVAKYYQDHLEPVAWWRRFIASGDTRLLVNAEEISVPLMSGSAFAN